MKMLLLLLLLLCVSCCYCKDAVFAAGDEKTRELLLPRGGVDAASNTLSYSGFRLVRFANLAANDVEMMANSLFFDIWDISANADAGAGNAGGGGGITVVAAVSQEQFALLFMGDEYEHEILVEDLGKQVLAERQRLVSRKPVENLREEFFEDFRSYEEITAYYVEMVALYPALASITVLGNTYENRQVYGVRLNATASTAASPKLFFQCSIHAREWISAPTCAWQLKQLLEGYGTNPDATFILNTFTVLIVPTVNPDGYAYTWSNDRMWRKNRAVFQGSTCRGVDLNRNWPSHWASSSNQCSDTYPGSSAASELETRAIGTWIQTQGNVQFNIDFHAYGELILRPWGNSVSPTPDESLLQDLGDGMRDAIRSVHNNLYTSQRSAQLYPADGETTDYYYDTVRVGTSGTKTKAWGFTFELRGNSFIIDSSEIIPQGEEIWAGLVYAAEWIDQNPPN